MKKLLALFIILTIFTSVMSGCYTQSSNETLNVPVTSNSQDGSNSLSSQPYTSLLTPLSSITTPMTSPITSTVSTTTPKTVQTSETGTNSPKTKYDLTISVDGSGTTNPNIGLVTYNEGSVVNVTATPASGWKFYMWIGDAS